MIIEKFLKCAASNPNAIALIHNKNSVDFRTLVYRVKKNASQLKKIGLNEHEPLGIVAHNSIDFVEWLFASFMTKNPAVLLPPYFRSEEFDYHISKIGLRFAILQKDYINNFNPDDLELIKENCFLWENMRGKPCLEKFCKEDFIVQFTSGSEGQSKAVVRTEKSLLSELKFLQESFPTSKFEVFAPISPMCHSFGLMGGTLFPLLNGYTVLIIDSLYIRDALYQMSSGKASCIFAAPYFYGQWAQILQKEMLDLSSLKRCYTAGTTTTQDIVENFYSFSKIEVYQDYGSTEMGTMALGIEPLRKTLELGRFIGNAKLRILPITELDSEDRLGELAIQNDIMDFRYLYPFECNLEKFRDGYYLTGDIVEKNNMQIFYKYRNDGCINIAGLKVYPSEVEQCIGKLSGVKDVAVTTCKNDKLEEYIVAYVVQQENERLTEQQIRTYCKKHLADYKMPKKVAIVEKLEKTTSGKLLKKYLPEILRD